MLNPKKNRRNILITSALPYVNNVPHLGNIIGCVLSADVWSRYCKAKNYNAIYICGTDEYGTATETKAKTEGLTEREICDKYNTIHQSVYKWFNINFDHFGRTSTQNPKTDLSWNQTIIAQDIFKKLVNNELLIEKTIEQLYCLEMNSFLADRYVSGICPHCNYEQANGDQCDNCSQLLDPLDLINPYCKINPEYTLERRSTDHLYLDLPQLQEKLKDWFDNNHQGWSKTAIGITKSWLNQELEPRCITRDLKWGTPVPNTEKYGDKYKDKVFYVWFDAPIGYISITADYSDQWKNWWKTNDEYQVEHVEFMAKDNVPFHSVIFPATLMGSGEKYNLVNRIAAVEYLNYEDKKFSKSRGTGVFGDTVQNSGIPSDVWRFYLLSIRPESSDAFFQWDDFAEKNNSDLVNNLGNLTNRILSFTHKKFKSVPKLVKNNDSLDQEFIDQVNKMTNEYFELMEDIKLRDGLKHLMAISKLGNKYIQDRVPWVHFKTNNQLCGNIIHICVHFIKHLAVLLKSYLPDYCQYICQILKVDNDNITNNLELGIINCEIENPKILFNKISEEDIKNLKSIYV